MKSHELKIWPREFQAIVAGRNTCEIGSNDCKFALGDVLVLQEWDPDAGEYTGQSVSAKVTHINHGGQFGVPEEICVMSIAVRGIITTRRQEVDVELIKWKALNEQLHGEG